MPANPVTDEMVERGAKALHSLKFDGDMPWDIAGKGYQEVYRNGARAALTAALADHVVVPREPTWQMRKAAQGLMTPASIYRAMISAAVPAKQEG